MTHARFLPAFATTSWIAALAWTATAVPAARSAEPAVVVAQGQAAADDQAAQATVNKVCTECHPTDRILTSRRTLTQWGEVMEEMVAQGAKVNDQDYDVILRWLVAKKGRVYVNVAPGDEMVSVLGLTEDDAEKIVAYRKEHGKFTDFDALLKVPTISSAALTAAKDAIAF